MPSGEAARDNVKHEWYILQVSFYQPVAGPARVLAKDEAHARELAVKLSPGLKDLEIHSCVREKDIDDTPPETPVSEDNNAPITLN